MSNKDYLLLAVFVLIVGFSGYLIIKNFMPEKNLTDNSNMYLSEAIIMNKDINKVNLESLQSPKFNDLSIGGHNMLTSAQLETVRGKTDPFSPN